VVGVEFVGGVAADKVEDGEGTAGVVGEPVLGDAEDEAVANDKVFTCEDAG